MTIRSMTGYGRTTRDHLTVEIKAVNHRYLDLSVRCPRVLGFLEEPVKQCVRQKVSRGSVDIGLTYDPGALELTKTSLNVSVLEGYLRIAEELSERYGLQSDLKVSSVLRLPEVVRFDKQELETTEMVELVCALTNEALDEFNAMREAEGARLREDILLKCEGLEQLSELVAKRSPVTLEAYRRRLETKLREFLDNRSIDENRILAEAAVFADRISVDEETVRLSSHIAQLRDMLGKGGVVGRKLDFLVQELGREINTIGSKGNDLEMSKIVVDLKAEVEKIREQIQNIE